MMKNFTITMLLLSSVLFFAGCGEEEYLTKTDSKGSAVYVGKGNEQVFFDHEDLYWFRSGFDDYKPNTDTIEELKKWKNDIYFIAFGGTWCDDTKDLLPKFYKAVSDSLQSG